jgi:hypothetical protein
MCGDRSLDLGVGAARGFVGEHMFDAGEGGELERIRSRIE